MAALFDNQGTYALLDAKCRALIISDASAALRDQYKPSTWQIFPPWSGRHLLSPRYYLPPSSNLGRKRLAIHALSLLAKFTTPSPEEIKHPWLEGYCHIDLSLRGV